MTSIESLVTDKDGKSKYGGNGISYRSLLAIFVLLFVTISLLQNSGEYKIIKRLGLECETNILVDPTGSTEQEQVEKQETINATKFPIIENSNIELPDLAEDTIEKVFERRKLIYQGSCQLIKKLITFNKKGLQNKSS